jgi:putative aldouronate transport system permease protein
MIHKKSSGSIAFDVVNYTFMILLMLLFLYPLVYTLALSLSSAKELALNNINLLPKEITFDSYVYLLSDGRILRYYSNTIIYASLGTAVMLFTTSLMAYPLMFKAFYPKKLITVLLTIPMFIGGGLIPTYLLMIKLGFIDKIWVMILPGAIGVWSVIIFRTFFSELPESLRESAYLDGANDFTILFRIIVPLSKALYATFILFSFVGYWNDYFTAIIYLHDDSKYPIAVLLRKLLILFDTQDIRASELIRKYKETTTRSVKSAAIIITIAPIICIYPFLQKYFVKGVIIGSIKG